MDHEDIDLEAFENSMEHIDMQMFLQMHGIDVSEAHELFRLLDHGENGRINVDEFVYGCQRLKGAAKTMDIVLLYEKLDTSFTIRN